MRKVVPKNETLQYGVIFLLKQTNYKIILQTLSEPTY